MTDDEFATLDANARRKAFTVAGVAQLDLVSEVQNQLVKSLESGVDFKEFQQAVTAKLEAAWGGPKSGRVETIFRTNIQTAYSAGRYGQMTSPLVLAARPVWVYDAILDSRTSKICGPLAGTTLPADDPWWDTRIPPLHHSCRSSLRSLTQAQADKQGITSSPPEINPASGFGARPDTTQWQPDPSKYEPSIIKGFVRKLLRMPTDLPTNTLLEPNGVPISESLKITKSKRAQATAIRSAIQALDETFADGMLHQASLELTSFARTGGQQGGFDALPRVGTRRILVDQNSPVAGLTALHEVAHRLDFDVLGNKTAFGSESQNPLSSSFQAMRIWRDAVRKSKAIRDLRNLRRQPEADQAHVKDRKAHV